MATTLDHPLTEVIPPLTLSDRCDSCGAQAWYAILMNVFNEAQLLFCSHHATKMELAIVSSKPFAIRDQRNELKSSENGNRQIGDI